MSDSPSSHGLSSSDGCMTPLTLPHHVSPVDDPEILYESPHISTLLNDHVSTWSPLRETYTYDQYAYQFPNVTAAYAWGTHRPFTHPVSWGQASDERTLLDVNTDQPDVPADITQSLTDVRNTVMTELINVWRHRTSLLPT